MVDRCHSSLRRLSSNCPARRCAALHRRLCHIALVFISSPSASYSFATTHPPYRSPFTRVGLADVGADRTLDKFDHSSDARSVNTYSQHILGYADGMLGCVDNKYSSRQLLHEKHLCVCKPLGDAHLIGDEATKTMNPFLSGKRIILRSLETTDLSLFWHWFADRDVVRYSMGTWQFPTSQTETADWLDRTIHDKRTLSLGIVEPASQQLIGYAGIMSISAINRSGEYYILIGDKTCWGKGYGTDTTRCVVAYGFESLNLNRIMLTVSSLNTAGIHAYTNAGFTREGVLRQACYRDGQYHDKIVMSILRSEWEQERP